MKCSRLSKSRGHISTMHPAIYLVSIADSDPNRLTETGDIGRHTVLLNDPRPSSHAPTMRVDGHSLKVERKYYCNVKTMLLIYRWPLFMEGLRRSQRLYVHSQADKVIDGMEAASLFVVEYLVKRRSIARDLYQRRRYTVAA